MCTHNLHTSINITCHRIKSRAPIGCGVFHSVAHAHVVYHAIKYPVLCTQITDGEKYKQNKHVRTYSTPVENVSFSLAFESHHLSEENH